MQSVKLTLSLRLEGIENIIIRIIWQRNYNNKDGCTHWNDFTSNKESDTQHDSIQEGIGCCWFRSREMKKRGYLKVPRGMINCVTWNSGSIIRLKEKNNLLIASMCQNVWCTFKSIIILCISFYQDRLDISYHLTNLIK